MAFKGRGRSVWAYQRLCELGHADGHASWDEKQRGASEMVHGDVEGQASCCCQCCHYSRLTEYLNLPLSPKTKQKLKKLPY